MTEQKLENLLNLALDATEEEREKSLNLDVGYYPIEKEWELIVKYSGSLETVREFAEQVTELKNEYAIVVVRESDIQRLEKLPQIEYIEKPKRLYFQVETEEGYLVSIRYKMPVFSFRECRSEGEDFSEKMSLWQFWIRELITQIWIFEIQMVRRES